MLICFNFMKYELKNIDGFDIICFENRSTNNGNCDKAVDWANKNKVGGFEDWVLPKKEVLSALCYLANGRLGEEFTWSSSSCVGNSYVACYVDFDFNGAFVDYESRNNYLAVRLVRASQCLAIGHAAVDRWEL